LDVDGRINVDTGVQDLLDVGVSFGMAAAWDVGVGELVDEDDLRAAHEDRVEVHLLEDPPSILDPLLRNHLEPPEQGLGFLAPLGTWMSPLALQTCCGGATMLLLVTLLGQADRPRDPIEAR